jgi:hypothetical protein
MLVVGEMAEHLCKSAAFERYLHGGDVAGVVVEKVAFFNDTATTEIYTFPYTTLFRLAS